MGKLNKQIVVVILVTFICGVLYIGFGAYYLNKSTSARHDIMQVQAEIAELSDLQYDFLIQTQQNQAFRYGDLDSKLTLNRDAEELKSIREKLNSSPNDLVDEQDSRLLHEYHLKKIGEEKSLSDALSKFGQYGYVLLGIAVFCFLIIAYLIIKMRRAHHRLNELYEGSNAIYKSSNDVIINVNREGVIARCSDSVLSLLGYSSSELIGQPLTKLVAEANQSEMVSNELLKTGKYLGEIENLRKDGTKVKCLLSANVLYDGGGKFNGSLGISREINDLTHIKNEYSYLLSQIADIVYRADATGQFTYANEAIEKVLGYTAEEIQGLHFSSLIHEDNLEEVVKHYDRFYRSDNENSSFEFKCRNKENKYVWVAQHVQKMYNDSGEVIGFTGVVRNIEERKRFELAIEESEQRYRELFENSLEIIHSISPDGKFIYVNNSWKDVFGYSDDEIAELTIMDIVAPGSLDHCQNLFAEILTTGQCKDGIVKYDVRTKAGKTLNLSGTVSIKQNEGNIVSIQSFLRDVTFEVKAQKIIQTQLKEINDSIDYAKNIQDSILPSKEEVAMVFENSYIYHQAKDVISGDFYDVSIIRTNSGDELKYAVVADCTGHGVPGGVLSMLCSAFLQDSYRNRDVNSPADSLNFVRDRLIQFFSSTKNKSIKDGMDVSFLVIDPNSLMLYASCANQRIIVLRGSSILEITGIKQSVGYSDQIEDFKNDSMQLERGDKIVMYSDGYVDQFGGESGKKFMRKRLHELLVNNYNLPCAELGRILEDSHRAWKGGTESTDDTTLMLIEV